MFIGNEHSSCVHRFYSLDGFVRVRRNANVTYDRHIQINAYFGYRVSFDYSLKSL